MKLLTFTGLVPEQICDTVRFFGYPGGERISHYCTYVSDFISYVRENPSVDGAVFVRTCDSGRTAASYLAESGKFVHMLTVPMRRDSGAKAYLADSLGRYKSAAEAYYGTALNDIPERTDMVNRRNQKLSVLYENMPEISYGAWLAMIHDLLRQPLYRQQVPESLEKTPDPYGPRVYLIGSTQTGTEIVRQIEDAGLNIVGDRLPESHRLISTPPVSFTGDILADIAESILAGMPSPSQNDFTAILKQDRAELIDKRVQGVIFITQKYCEPYDYLFPAYRKMLEELNIPVLRMAVSGTQTEKGNTLSIETFADMLS